MSLLDEIQTEQASARRGPDCAICSLLVNMDKADSRDLQSALDDSTVYHSVISKALAKRNIRVHPQTVGRHRKGECAGL